MSLAALGARGLATVITIAVDIVGSKKIDETTHKFDLMKSSLAALSNVFARAARASHGFMLESLSKPPGLEASSLFKIARGINTLAANIRFFQLTIAMFIGGNVVKGFIGSFVELNKETQTAALSLQAIIQAQKEMSFKKLYGYSPSENLPAAVFKKSLKAAAQEANDLAEYSTTLALRSGGKIYDMIQAARGIQVNTGDIKQTKRLLDTAVQLALLDPDQGMAGATFAIRELLQGQGARDFKSLAQRFELSFSMEFKKKFTQSVQTGKIKEAIDMFQKELAAKGISDKILKNLERSMVLSLNVIKGYTSLFFADIGKPLFHTLNNYVADIAKYFMVSGKNLQLKPEYQLIKFNIGEILDNSIGKPLIDRINKLVNYFRNLFMNISFYDFIKKNISNLQSIFDKIKYIFTESLTSFFKFIGVLDNNGDLFKSGLNFISLLIERVGLFLDTFIKEGGLDVLMLYMREWAQYYSILFSEKHIRTIVYLTKLQFIWNTMLLNFQESLIGVVIQLGEAVDTFVDSMNYFTNLVQTFYLTIFGGQKKDLKFLEEQRNKIIEHRKLKTMNQRLEPLKTLPSYLIPLLIEGGSVAYKGNYSEFINDNLNNYPSLNLMDEESRKHAKQTINLLSYIKETGSTSNTILERLLIEVMKSNMTQEEFNEVMKSVFGEENIAEDLIGFSI